MNDPVECDCGAEMRLRAEGTERPTAVVADSIQFRGYVCPRCGDRTRFEYDDDGDEWNRADD